MTPKNTGLAETMNFNSIDFSVTIIGNETGSLDFFAGILILAFYVCFSKSCMYTIFTSWKLTKYAAFEKWQSRILSFIQCSTGIKRYS